MTTPTEKSGSIRTDKRARPRQGRSEDTVRMVLDAAAELLVEVGFEKLTTNAICARAGLTPPALYRYFPNKYAVLKEMGERLMSIQNEALSDWAEQLEDGQLDADDMAELLRVTLRVTRDYPAGGWIMRSLHASPVLADVRINSHRDVTQLMTDQLLKGQPELDPQAVYRITRTNVEIGYAVLEMIFDEPELDEAATIDDTAHALMANYARLLMR